MRLIHKKKELLIGTIVLIGSLCANAWVANRQTTTLHDNAAWVTHTHQVIAGVERLLATLTRAESGQRGYLLTGDRRYLIPYEEALGTYRQNVDRLRELTVDNSDQRKRVDRLQELIAARLDTLTQAIALLDNRGLDAARDYVVLNRGLQLMSEIQEQLEAIRQSEYELLAARDAANTRAFRTALISSLLAALLGLIAVAAFVWLLSRHLAAVEEAATLVHQQRELLQATLVSIGDAVIATDSRGCVTFLNTVAQTLTGWTEIDARGRTLDSVFHIVNESTREPVENPALRAIRDGKVIGLANHTVLIARNGFEWPIDDSAAPIRTPAGQVNGAILVFREISERKKHDAALQEANRRKDEFLATLAHELRNPLAPISNALQVWPLVESDRAQMEQLREIMERQVKQMTRLIDELLDVSRVTRGKIELRPQSVDLATLISSAVETVDPLIVASGHRLTVDLPDEPIVVDGDVARLTQVFGNILHNAAKYTGRNGHIQISARRENANAVVRIRDNGPGIPPDMLSRIFEMFQQVDQTLDRSHGGLGIGLTLVRRLVELHGGHVEAHSDGPGTGSEFVVTLPVGRSTAADQPVTERGVRRPLDLPVLRILVVDDVLASAKTLALMLRSIGQDVSVLHEGQAAIDWIHRHQPDLVLLDIAMPGMDGYEVARQVRQDPRVSGTYLVALTGYGQEEDRRRAIEAGFNHHMTKPTSIESLQQLLRTRPASARSAGAPPAQRSSDSHASAGSGIEREL